MVGRQNPEHGVADLCEGWVADFDRWLRWFWRRDGGFGSLMGLVVGVAELLAGGSDGC